MKNIKQTCTSLTELLSEISPYINQSALARICNINEGQ